MRRRTLCNAKLVVKVIGNKIDKTIRTVSVYDNREQKEWCKDRIEERGIESFINMEDMKETLNWNLNGDSSKFQFSWGQSSKGSTDGTAYIFD